MNFTEQFDRYACPGDTITTEVGPLTVTAEIVHDEMASLDDCDTHNTDRDGPVWFPRWDGWEEQYNRAMAAREAFERGEWFYCGVRLSVSVDGIVLDPHAASLWGMECNYPTDNVREQDRDQRGPNGYLTDVANEMLPEALEAAGARMADLLRASAEIIHARRM